MNNLAQREVNSQDIHNIKKCLDRIKLCKRELRSQIRKPFSTSSVGIFKEFLKEAREELKSIKREIGRGAVKSLVREIYKDEIEANLKREFESIKYFQILDVKVSTLETDESQFQNWDDKFSFAYWGSSFCEDFIIPRTEDHEVDADELGDYTAYSSDMNDWLRTPDTHGLHKMTSLFDCIEIERSDIRCIKDGVAYLRREKDQAIEKQIERVLEDVLEAYCEHYEGCDFSEEKDNFEYASFLPLSDNMDNITLIERLKEY